MIPIKKATSATHYGYNPNEYLIEKSLRLRSSNSAYLSRTPSISGNRSTWTFSTWVKRGQLGVISPLLGYGVTGVFDNFFFNTSDQLQYYSADTSGTVNRANYSTTSVFRDSHSHLHVVLRINTASLFANERVSIYVNGVRQVLTPTFPIAQNWTTYLNSNVQNNIGFTYDGTNRYFDGYIADVNFIDGQALPPTAFGYKDDFDGKWKPKGYSGSYGTNGFYLKFSDNSSLTTASNVGLGKDSSPNNNYWVTNGISITNDATYDSMKDVPGNSYYNLTQLQPYSAGAGVTVSDGGLKVSQNYSGSASVRELTPPTSTIPYAYMEVSVVSGAYYSGGSFGFGFKSGATYPFLIEYADVGTLRLYVNGSFTSQPTLTNCVVAGHTTGFAIDNVTNKVYIYLDGTLVYTSATITNLPTSAFTTMVSGNGGTQVFTVNFGQQPFKYTPPVGYLPFCTKNLG